MPRAGFHEHPATVAERFATARVDRRGRMRYAGSSLSAPGCPTALYCGPCTCAGKLSARRQAPYRAETTTSQPGPATYAQCYQVQRFAAPHKPGRCRTAGDNPEADSMSLTRNPVVAASTLFLL